MSTKDTKVIPTQEFTNYSDAEVIELLQNRLFAAEIKYKRTLVFGYVSVLFAALVYTATNASSEAFWGCLFVGSIAAFILDELLGLKTISNAIVKLRESIILKIN